MADSKYLSRVTQLEHFKKEFDETYKAYLQQLDNESEKINYTVGVINTIMATISQLMYDNGVYIDEKEEYRKSGGWSDNFER